MDRRTFEGPMEWEYQGTGPVDVSSPFAKHMKNKNGASAQNGFSTPSNIFAAKPAVSSASSVASYTTATSTITPTQASLLPSTPVKARPAFSAIASAPSSTSIFANPHAQAQAQAQAQAPAPSAQVFRNPAFTTPRKTNYSTTDTNPALTDKTEKSLAGPGSEADHDVDMDADRTDDSFATITPARIDKRLRYTGIVKRPGRGEIPRAHKSFSTMEVIRHRKRQVLDRDIGGSRYRLDVGAYDDGDDDGDDGAGNSSDNDASDYDSGADDGRPVSSSSAGSMRGRRNRQQQRQRQGQRQQPQQKQPPGQHRGWMGGMLKAMEEHPNAPENIYKWMQVCFNVVIFSGIMVFCWQVIGAIKSDLDKANAAARANSINEVQECTTNYIENRCGQAGGPVPYLRDRCTEWDVCMQRDVDAVMSMRVVIREIAEIVNEFSGTMQFRSWLLIGGLLFVAIFAANVSLFRSAHPHQRPSSSTPLKPQQSAAAAAAAAAAASPRYASPFGGPFGSPFAGQDTSQGFMYVPLQTPTSRRQMAAMFDAGSDGETEEPRSRSRRRGGGGSRMQAIMGTQTPSRGSPFREFGAEYRDRDRSLSPSKRAAHARLGFH